MYIRIPSYIFSILTYLIFTYLLLFLISGFTVLLALIFGKCATRCYYDQSNNANKYKKQ